MREHLTETGAICGVFKVVIITAITVFNLLLLCARSIAYVHPHWSAINTFYRLSETF